MAELEMRCLEEKAPDVVRKLINHAGMKLLTSPLRWGSAAEAQDSQGGMVAWDHPDAVGFNPYGALRLCERETRAGWTAFTQARKLLIDLGVWASLTSGEKRWYAEQLAAWDGHRSLKITRIV